eukprot:2363043-Rhodomonas_salina.7
MSGTDVGTKHFFRCLVLTLRIAVPSVMRCRVLTQGMVVPVNILLMALDWHDEVPTKRLSSPYPWTLNPKHLTPDP